MRHALKVAAGAALAAAVVGACSSTPSASTEATPRVTAQRAAKTVEVKMMNDGGMNRFEPKDIRINVGDTVKWVAVGGSHNISFWADSLPAGALAPMRAAMKDTVATLRTARFPNPGDNYSIVFSGAPKGVYKYYCGPHLMRGMVATITIE